MPTFTQDPGVPGKAVSRPVARQLSSLYRDEAEATSTSDSGNGQPVVPATRRTESGGEHIAAMNPSVRGGTSQSSPTFVSSNEGSTTTHSRLGPIDGASGAYHDERKEHTTSGALAHDALAQDAQNPVPRPAIIGDRRGIRSPGLSFPPSSVVPDSSKKSIPPLSTPRRNRGYSLRRSLFSRALHGNAIRPGPAIELEPARAPYSLSSIPSDDKKDETERVPGAARATMSRQGVDSVRECNNDPGRRKLAYLQKSWDTRMGSRPWPQSKLTRAFETLRAKVWKVKEGPLTGDGRHIDLDIMCKDLIDGRATKEYVDNTITSSRYTIWNFIPRQLFAQFSKLANL